MEINVAAHQRPDSLVADIQKLLKRDEAAIYGWQYVVFSRHQLVEHGDACYSYLVDWYHSVLKRRLAHNWLVLLLHLIGRFHSQVDFLD